MIANNVIALGSSIVFARLTQRLRLAGRAGQLLPDPDRRRPGDAGRDRARGRARSPRRRGGAARDDPELDPVTLLVHRGRDRDLDACPPADRRCRRRQARSGRPRSGSRPAACTCCSACCAARCRGSATTARRHQPDRRAGAHGSCIGGVLATSASASPAPTWAPLSFVAMSLYCAVPPAPAARRYGAGPGRATRRCVSLWVHVRGRVGGDRRRWPSSRCSRTSTSSPPSTTSQARGQLLQRDRGRRQGPDLGRDGSRLLPRARGLAPARGGRGHPAGAGSRSAIVAVCAIPCMLIYAFACHPLLIRAAFGAKRAARGRRAVRPRSSRSRCWPPPTWRSSTCWR